jgi:hypothetical protein
MATTAAHGRQAQGTDSCRQSPVSLTATGLELYPGSIM